VFSTAFTNPPQRRAAGLALNRDEKGRVLLVEKVYREGPARFGLVGGMAHAGEHAARACQRHIRRETGLRIVPGALLVVHYMPEEGEVKEGHNFVFDCKAIPSNKELVLAKDEFRGFHWLDKEELPGLVAPYTEWRINLALAALAGGPTRYVIGHPQFPLPAPA
jgi:ADP-ribose pyrophosphatase YjhB (NUDIX family)